MTTKQMLELLDKATLLELLRRKEDERARAAWDDGYRDALIWLAGLLGKKPDPLEPLCSTIETEIARLRLGASDTAYRKGVPSIELRQEHEKAGGGWHIMVGDKLMLGHTSWGYAVYIQSHIGWEPAPETAAFRPCASDGTPVCWSTITKVTG